MLRIIAVILVVLTTGKIALGEYYYRAATHDLIVRAYRDTAAAGCARTTKIMGVTMDPAGWSSPADVRLDIGRRDADVLFFDTAHSQWSQRWRDPYMQLTSRSGAGSLTCTYDVLRGTAAVRQE